MNSQNPTKQYEQLVGLCGDKPSHEATSSFIDMYLLEKDVSIEKYIEFYQEDWNNVANEYVKIAEDVFSKSLPKDVTAYLTINSRCPYSLGENYFFVTVPADPHMARKTVMHELWHFYTWYAFGVTQQERLGKQKYNDIKEALTVLINVECKDLLPEGVVDKGYPQHEELRARILDIWAKDKNIYHVWEALINMHI